MLQYLLVSLCLCACGTEYAICHLLSEFQMMALKKNTVFKKKETQWKEFYLEGTKALSDSVVTDW